MGQLNYGRNSFSSKIRIRKKNPPILHLKITECNWSKLTVGEIQLLSRSGYGEKSGKVLHYKRIKFNWSKLTVGEIQLLSRSGYKKDPPKNCTIKGQYVTMPT